MEVFVSCKDRVPVQFQAGGSIRKEMMFIFSCLECNLLTQSRDNDAKFCSRSCSAVFNNRERGYRECLNCRSRVSYPKKYCDKMCEVSHRSRQIVLDWLSTGEGNIKNKSIKNYILKEQQGVCAMEGCFVSAKWNGKPLVFVQDHINGNSDDNRRENIRMICSNCDSQLDTYKSKNKGNGRHYRRTRYAEGKSY